MTVSALVSVAAMDKQTAGHGRLLSPKKYDFMSEALDERRPMAFISKM
jgi:hypothetical protein